jgi:hypothetical protein
MMPAFQTDLHQVGIECGEGALERAAQDRNGLARSRNDSRTFLRISEPGPKPDR